MTIESAELAATIVARIAEAPIEEFPCPHIIIDNVVPPVLYARALRELPAQIEGRMAGGGALGVLHDGLACAATATALVEKFANHPLAIPVDQHHFFTGGATDYSATFELSLDRSGHAIAPHTGVGSTLVVCELHLAKTDALARYGTCFCVPDDPRVYKGRSRIDRTVGRALSRLLKNTRLLHRLERTRFGLRVGVGEATNWFPWEWFTIAKVAEARPNRLIAFPPNDRSFHAANFSPPPVSPVRERCVLRGSVVPDQKSSTSPIVKHHLSRVG